MPRQCIICKEPQSASFSVFSFPSAVQKRGAWIEAVKELNPGFRLEHGDKRLKNGICQRHFLNEEMNDGKKKRVKRLAVPSIGMEIIKKLKKTSIVHDGMLIFPQEAPHNSHTIERQGEDYPTSKEIIFPSVSNSALCSYPSDDPRMSLNNPCHEEAPLNGFTNRSVQTEDKPFCIELNIAENGNWKSSRSLMSISDESSNDEGNSAHLDKEWKSIEYNENLGYCSLCLKLENCRLYRLSQVIIENLRSYLLEYLPQFTEAYWCRLSALDGDVCCDCIHLLEDLHQLMSGLIKKIKTLKRVLNNKIHPYNNNRKENDKIEKVAPSHADNVIIQNLRRHKRLKSKTFPCPECSEKFSSLAMLSKHLESHECSGTMEDTPNMSLTSKVTLKSTEHKCHLCLKGFYSRQELAKHRKTHNDNSECPVCRRHLTTKARLKLHLYNFHKIGEPTLKSFHCSLCSKSFSTKSGLTYHENVHHKKETQYICNICSKSFYYSILFKSHMLYSHSEKTVVCEICGKMFFTVSKLNEHINAIHRNAKSWSCKFCGEKFTTTWAYKSHVSIKHKKILYSCGHCSASFTRKTILTVHLWKHGVYSCLSCNSRFNTADSYNTHMIQVHQKDISKRIKDSLKVRSIGEHNRSFAIDQIKYSVNCKKPIEINDILMNEDVFNNPNLSSAAFISHKMKKGSLLDSEDGKVKSLNMLESSQDLSSVDTLNLCSLNDLKIVPDVSDDRITLEEDVSLLHVQMLEEIEDFRLKEGESESVCMNQVFQEDLSSEADPTKDSQSETGIIGHMNITHFTPDSVSTDVNLAFSDSSELGPMQRVSKIAKQVVPMVIDSSRTLNTLPVIFQTVEKEEWHLTSHFNEKVSGVQPVIHTLTVDDDVGENPDTISLLSKNVNLTMENASEGGDSRSLMDKRKLEEPRPLPTFSLGINDRDHVQYKYVMLVDTNSNPKKGS